MKKYNEFILYSVFGTTATFLYFFARFTSKNWTSSVLVSVMIAQAVAILFSFFTNKFIVFKNKDLGFVKSLQQFGEFLAARLAVILLDLGIAYFFVEKYHRTMIQAMHLQKINYANHSIFTGVMISYMGNAYLLNEFIFTVISQVLATIINYVVSKRIVFNVKKNYEATLSAS